MSELRLTGVTAGHGSEKVLDDVALTVREGRTTAVLGASGSGKTTLLRVVAGFLRPWSGTVVVDGRTVVGPGVWVPPERRGVGYVRQDGALFPHLTVAENVAFGLPRPRRRHRERVRELLDVVGLPDTVAERFPHQLSGGQQQRVALARALAPRPGLVLLDEPFSSLDTGLRASTREAIGRALRATGATALLVTHDQDEALSFADEVAILARGRFRQVGTPDVVYRDPVDVAVAEFLGEAVVLAGTVDGERVACPLGVLPVQGDVPGREVDVMVRPEQLCLGPAGTGGLDALVRGVTYFGHDAVVELEAAELEVAGAAAPGLRARVLGVTLPAPGDRVGVSVTGPVRVFARHAGGPHRSPVTGRSDPSADLAGSTLRGA